MPCAKPFAACLLALLSPFAAASIWNNPYPGEDPKAKILYSSFAEPPKTLDPAKSYSDNEYSFIAQIYEPLLQYDYFSRPFQLVPLTAQQMPEIHYYDQSGKEIQALDPEKIAKTVYRIAIKNGIFYQAHPAFAKDANGKYLYYPLPANYFSDGGGQTLADFTYSGSRELKAADYLYQIKRMADPSVNSPIYGLMSEKIIGFKDFAKTLKQLKVNKGFIDLRQVPMQGLRLLDDYHFEISLEGSYPQFSYWLAMNFFVPIPWEVDRFYSQKGMAAHNIGFSWSPVGTGPFILHENNPNSRMVLIKNPQFHGERFPSNASETDRQLGYTAHIGEALPLIDKAVFSLEKESIPRWNKFLQGYYDLSGIANDSFDQAIQIRSDGRPVLSPVLADKGMRLNHTINPLIAFLGFNQLDPVVGGPSSRARKLRQAISIAINYEEYIALFYNGRGKPAQGPIPPGLFGYRSGQAGMNPYVYSWENGQPKRLPIARARALMKEAGYDQGIDPETGKALILHYDVPAGAGPDEKEQLNWMRKQFAKLGIELNIRGTQYNRFQEKMRAGNTQIFSWAWNADYPDPENFFFLLYGPNSKVAYGGENTSNYSNPEFDRLFLAMKNRPNDSRRQALIDKMLAILQADAPWVFGMQVENMLIQQAWVAPLKPNAVNNNLLKYRAVAPNLRAQLQQRWNRPLLWPIAAFILANIILILPFGLAYRQSQRQAARRYCQ